MQPASGSAVSGRGWYTEEDKDVLREQVLALMRRLLAGEQALPKPLEPTGLTYTTEMAPWVEQGSYRRTT